MLKVNNKNIDLLLLFRARNEHDEEANVDLMSLLLSINTFSIFCHVMPLVPFCTSCKYQKTSGLKHDMTQINPFLLLSLGMGQSFRYKQVVTFRVSEFLFFFNCYLAVPRPTLGHSPGVSLTNPMLSLHFNDIDPKVTGNLVIRMGPQAWSSAQWCLNQEPSDFNHNALTH